MAKIPLFRHNVPTEDFFRTEICGCHNYMTNCECRWDFRLGIHHLRKSVTKANKKADIGDKTEIGVHCKYSCRVLLQCISNCEYRSWLYTRYTIRAQRRIALRSKTISLLMSGFNLDDEITQLVVVTFTLNIKNISKRFKQELFNIIM